MVGLILCVVICGFAFGFGIYAVSDGDCGSFGALIGVLVGFVLWFTISVPVLEYTNANSKLISSIEYKIEMINGQYWETDRNSRKVVHYVDEGKELQSYTASMNEIEYSDTISEPTLIIEKRDAFGWFINFWCGGDTDYTNYRVVMPRAE
jgi:hypothetical protein